MTGLARHQVALAILLECIRHDMQAVGMISDRELIIGYNYERACAASFVDPLAVRALANQTISCACNQIEQEMQQCAERNSRAEQKAKRKLKKKVAKYRRASADKTNVAAAEAAQEYVDYLDAQASAQRWARRGSRTWKAAVRDACARIADAHTGLFSVDDIYELEKTRLMHEVGTRPSSSTMRTLLMNALAQLQSDGTIVAVDQRDTGGSGSSSVSTSTSSSNRGQVYRFANAARRKSRRSRRASRSDKE